MIGEATSEHFHSMHCDGAKMRDRLVYDAFRMMGIVSPQCGFAEVYVNDEFLGLYALVEFETESQRRQGSVLDAG